MKIVGVEVTNQHTDVRMEDGSALEGVISIKLDVAVETPLKVTIEAYLMPHSLPRSEKSRS
jgi:hypothetical protein